MAISLPRESNRVTAIGGTSSVDGSVVAVFADPTTHRLYVNSAASLVVGTTTITGGSNGKVLYDNNGVIGEQAPLSLTTTGSSGAATLTGSVLNIPQYTGGSGTVTTVSVATANGFSGTVANATTTPAITIIAGAITPTSVNSVVISGSSTPTLAVTGTSSISGSNTGDQTSVSGSAGSVALSGVTGLGTGVATALAINIGTAGAVVLNSVTTLSSLVSVGTIGTGVWQGTIIGLAYGGTGVNNTNNAVTVSTNAATVPVTYRLTTVTNNAAGSVTITITTTSATDGQLLIVRFYDYSAAAQTISWTNTENSTVSVPTTSNGSTTLPVTVGFMFNSQTTKWRVLAVA
jgi:hypothetical protein